MMSIAASRTYSDSSLFPKPNIWAKGSYCTPSWTSEAEKWFRLRMEKIRKDLLEKRDPLVMAKEWRNKLIDKSRSLATKRVERISRNILESRIVNPEDVYRGVV